MTPERKEEIKRDYDDMKEVGMYVPELLAALEEAQQAITALHEYNHRYAKERDEAKQDLAEAQQTIARQREALQSIYEESEDKGARHCAAMALGIVWEGDQP